MKRSYKYLHIVGFEETNLVGNVYYANHIKWQGRCREMFLKDHAAEVLPMLESGEIALVTLSCSCEYFGELKAFDEVTIEMELGDMKQNRLEMNFKYYKEGNLIAGGRQEIACMKRTADGFEALPFPETMFNALHEYETSNSGRSQY